MYRIASIVVLLSYLVAFPQTCQECHKNYNDRVAYCDATFNSKGSVYYHDTQWHKQCLDTAKTDFDNCRSVCK